MDATRWSRVREIVADASELEGEPRARLLELRCGRDLELLAECESLLAQAAHVEQRLGGAGAPLAELSRSPDALAGARAGAWRIVRELGSGGMGAVFLAERSGDGFAQRGALKVLGQLAGHGARERFRLEQRALARLEHPGIARLIDAGELDDGRPFLVMELVEGAPIASWCDERKLGVRAKVELMAQVCEAVQHAHQNLVVHRDLKPSNVLVDAAGRPRLVDFGIARVLEESASPETTRELPRAFTPRYASPEQVRGESASTASDVYSLGVLLYELLAGASPYGGATRSTQEVERAVRELEPARPSDAARARPGGARLGAALRGDLDAIVLRAMAKDPLRRYASASELALDLRRHLRGDVVSARPDTLVYRASTLVRRHRLAALFAAAFVLALVVGAAAALRQSSAARRAERNERALRQLSDARYSDLRELARALVFDAHDSIRDLPGATAARASLLESGRALLERLERHGADDPELAVDLARSYVRLGELHGRASESGLGDVTGAERAYRRAIGLASSALGRNPRARYALAQARAKLGELFAFEGRADEARAELEGALAQRVELLELEPASWQEDPDLGYLNERLFDLEVSQGDLAAALEHLDEAERFMQACRVSAPERVLWRENLALLWSHRAKLHELRRELDTALEWRRKSVELFDSLRREAPERSRTRQRFVQGLGDLGSLLTRLGERDAARETLERALAEGRELCDSDPVSAAYRSDLAVTSTYRGELASSEGRNQQALEAFRDALELRRELARLDPASARALRAQAVAADMVGGALRALGRLEEAERHHREAHDVFVELAARPGANVEARRSLAVSCYELGRLQRTRAEALEDPAASGAEWASAREYFARATGIVDELAASGALSPRDGHVAELLRSELAHCDAALAAR